MIDRERDILPKFRSMAIFALISGSFLYLIAQCNWQGFTTHGVALGKGCA